MAAPGIGRMDTVQGGEARMEAVSPAATASDSVIPLRNIPERIVFVIDLSSEMDVSAPNTRSISQTRLAWCLSRSDRLDDGTYFGSVGIRGQSWRT